MSPNDFALATPTRAPPQQGNERRMGGLLGVAFDPALDVGEAAIERQAGEFIQGLILRQGIPGQNGLR